MADRTILTPYFLDETLPGLKTLLKPNWEMNEPELPQGDSQHRMSVLHEPIASFVSTALKDGDRPISIAGDCCTTLAVTAGIQRAGFDHLLIWFDAHGDFNTWETSPSGFLGGMPLAMLVGRGEQTMLEALTMRPLAEKRVIFTDGRDLDPQEREALDSSKVTHLRQVQDLLVYDLPDLPLHIHFDTDILNPETAPAMNYLADGGPDLETLEGVFRHLAKTGQVSTVSLSSWNPELDSEDRTRKACMQALESLVDAY